MRVVVQRVQKAAVTIDNKVVGEIDNGLLLFVGIENEDTSEDIEWLSNKIARLRIFGDENGAMNLSVADISGGILSISQFTLFASTKKGNRPSFKRSGEPQFAKEMYLEFNKKLSNVLGQEIQTGVFAADMQVELLNDGPVTICIDSKQKE